MTPAELLGESRLLIALLALGNLPPLRWDTEPRAGTSALEEALICNTELKAPTL